MAYESLLKEEQNNADRVYSSLEREVKELVSAESREKAYAGFGDDVESFMSASSAARATQTRQAKQQQYKSLFDKPYFAHIQMRDAVDGDTTDCLLSDNADLDSMIPISGRSPMQIIPFKQDKQRPFFSAAFHCYQARDGKSIPVRVTDVRTGKSYEQHYIPQLVRDVDVFRRRVDGVVPYFPQVSEEAPIDSDELLAQRLEENRNDARLRNIIATLQRQQFDIIRTDIDTSFVVQGCAGSGKTQCLIHRLFFLRDYLEDSGWNKVLLITPTQLFRNYSSELIRRYRLQSVENESLSEFYKQLLEALDPRFSARQYKFELTEEYLPDAYLQQIYASPQIEKIDLEIERAIESYVAEGCRLTGDSVPEAKQIDIAFVNDLASKLAALVQRYDETESALAEDKEFQAHRLELEKLEKELAGFQRRLNTAIDTRAKLESEKSKFDSLVSALEAATKDAEDNACRRKDDIKKLADRLRDCIQQLEKARTAAKYARLFSAYAALRGEMLDRIEFRSEDARFEQDYATLLDDIVKGCQEALQDFTNGQQTKTWLNRWERQTKANQASIADITESIDITNLLIEDHNKWLAEHDLEDAKNQRRAHRAELERARYFLSRIESAVFETEVWNALAPLKTECGIKTIETEQLSNGRQKQTRILYKSDLLFYLHIYVRLHKNRDIPDYKFICIDEGQDLHKADFEMIKALYPTSVLNVFGDTEQVLHEACGIRDWKAETGIATLYVLNDNYRNNAAIADFCNNRFGSKMAYYGKVIATQKPVMIPSLSKIDASMFASGAVVVLKDEAEYAAFLAGIHDRALRDRFKYVDTRAESVPNGVIPCYSVFAAKGLEFSTALVYAESMTRNQKVVACTRAMEKLFYCEG